MENLYQLTVLQIFLIAALLLLIHCSIWGLIAIWKRRGDLADTAWGLGFLLVSWASFSVSPFSYKSLILNLCVSAWSVRLSIHIFLRNRTRKEDFRYEQLKTKWRGKFALRMFFQIFLMQGAILYIVALPILWINAHPENIEWSVLSLALFFWLAGFLVETIGDYQLNRFRKKESNQGKLLTTGLWSYVRHPNYLGEIVQWWAIWAAAGNPYLLVSPLLISLLIIKVSGIAPVEEKMKDLPGFEDYARKTPSLIPPQLANGAFYSLSWYMIVASGAKGLYLFPLSIFILNYALQLFLFSKWDRKSLLVSPILSIYALLLGLIQEAIFINFDLLNYPNHTAFPPFWLLSLYPLFALNLNSSLGFLNKNLSLSFILGGIGALGSYIWGEKIGGVEFVGPISYAAVILSWGLYLSFLIFLNRKLNLLLEKYTDPLRNQLVLTVFFDEDCPICSAEMEKLKKRRQTGKVDYASLRSEEEFKKKSQGIVFEGAMKKIHAIDLKGNITKGIDALSELYARTDLPFVAILLQSPFLHGFFYVCYAIWAKIRI